MSTLRVSSINNAAASAGGIAIDSSGGVSGALPAPNRNLLYNGAMQLSQRGTSTTGITTGGYYTADRWQVDIVSMGTWTQDIQNDAPTGSGFRRSLRMLCTTADAAPAATDAVTFDYKAEGQDLQRIAKGTSSARQLTLSFWVKSNVTGTYTAMLYDLDNSRFVSRSYTISASATWEKKTITFPADTTGAFDNDNAASLLVRFHLGVGSSFSSGTLQTTWGSDTAANRAVGQTNLAAAINNYWQVTGVQLEVGDVATDFEFKSFGQELRECQRYYHRTYSSGTYGAHTTATPAQATTNLRHIVVNPVPMRVAATAIDTANLTAYDGSAILTPSAIAIDSTLSTATHTSLNSTVTGATQYRPYYLVSNNNVSGYLGLSAEL